ncbi:LamG domain-containing protein [Rathayibacter sp. ZW T2_19]|uniref:LamG domain-containing protein n=1 Tax=Rathayibacter rubneri TaxID=2950106 RepID=A0A9X2ISG4_9MICO|nr:LamG domain-containing protein [Rathayibacter rubneri]MCM6762656.1 LamG domain-containing protein [Rathayibacter rubneri]
MSRHRVVRVPLLARLRSALAQPRKAAAAVAVAALAGALLLTPATSGAYTASITNSNNKVGSAAAFFTCDAAYAADRGAALFSYTLAQASGSSTAADTDSGAYTGYYQGTMTSSPVTPKACPRDAGGSWLLNGTTNHLTNQLQLNNPTTFSTEIWFKTTVAGGKLFSFGAGPSAGGGQYDRHTYIGRDGKLVFGIYNFGVEALTSPTAVNDGNWHHVVSTLSPTTGMTLYLDGQRVASNTAYRSPENTTGYWRIGYDTLGGSWPNVGSAYFSGSLRYAAVYSTALTQTQVQNHYTAGRAT